MRAPITLDLHLPLSVPDLHDLEVVPLIGVTLAPVPAPARA